MMRVERGDIYAIGPHRVMCGDVEKGDALSFLGALSAEDRVPTMAWTDPPYDMRVARNFRRAAGVEGEPDIGRLLSLALGALTLVDGPCYMEMGSSGVDALRAALSHYPPKRVHEWDHLTYDRGARKLWIFGMEWREDAPEMRRPEGDGWAAARSVMSVLSERRVFDPFMGEAGFGKIALEHGHSYVGMELQPGRVEVALRALSKRTKAPPDYLGNIINKKGRRSS